MAAQNPFDLNGKVGPAAPHAARVWTPDEQAEKLVGYIEVVPEFWEQIRYGTHVRYVTKAGEFRTGGFVLKNPFDTRPSGAAADKRFMRLQNGFSDKVKGYAQWLLAYEDTARVYMKPDAAVMMSMQSLELAVRGLNDNVRKLVEYSKKLEGRISELEGGRRR